jgi:hypothetical protein
VAACSWPTRRRRCSTCSHVRRCRPRWPSRWTSSTCPATTRSWRTFLIDPHSGTPQPLEIATGGGSRAFGNPTATELTAPDGRPAVLVTRYVFAEGAARSEAGPVVYYVER